MYYMRPDVIWKDLWGNEIPFPEDVYDIVDSYFQYLSKDESALNEMFSPLVDDFHITESVHDYFLWSTFGPKIVQGYDLYANLSKSNYNISSIFPSIDKIKNDPNLWYTLATPLRDIADRDFYMKRKDTFPISDVINSPVTSPEALENVISEMKKNPKNTPNLYLLGMMRSKPTWGDPECRTAMFGVVYSGLTGRNLGFLLPKTKDVNHKYFKKWRKEEDRIRNRLLDDFDL